MLIEEVEAECDQYFDQKYLANITDFAKLSDSSDDEEEEEEKEDEVYPPGELQMLWMTKSYNALPWKGGLMDQPYFLMICMNVCESSENKAKEIMRRIAESRRKQNGTNI